MTISTDNNQKSRLVADFYQSHHADLINFVCARLGNREESEDLVQDVAVKMLTLDAPICVATVKSFAYTIAANKVKDVLRRRIFRRHVEEHTVYVAERSCCGVERVVEYRETLRLLDKAMSRLTPSCARVYHMSFVDDMPSGEIAQEIGVSKRTVETQLLASRKKVRAFLKAAM